MDGSPDRASDTATRCVLELFREYFKVNNFKCIYLFSGVPRGTTEQEAVLGGGLEVLPGSRSGPAQLHRRRRDERPAQHRQRVHQVSSLNFSSHKGL